MPFLTTTGSKWRRPPVTPTLSGDQEELGAGIFLFPNQIESLDARVTAVPESCYLDLDCVRCACLHPVDGGMGSGRARRRRGLGRARGRPACLDSHGVAGAGHVSADLSLKRQPALGRQRRGGALVGALRASHPGLALVRSQKGRHGVDHDGRDGGILQCDHRWLDRLVHGLPRRLRSGLASGPPLLGRAGANVRGSGAQCLGGLSAARSAQGEVGDSA